MVLFGGVWVCFLIQGSQSLYFLSKKNLFLSYYMYKFYFYPILSVFYPKTGGKEFQSTKTKWEDQGQLEGITSLCIPHASQF